MNKFRNVKLIEVSIDAKLFCVLEENRLLLEIFLSFGVCRKDSTKNLRH